MRSQPGDADEIWDRDMETGSIAVPGRLPNVFGFMELGWDLPGGDWIPAARPTP